MLCTMPCFFQHLDIGRARVLPSPIGMMDQIGGDRDSSRNQKFRQRFSNRQAEASQRDLTMANRFFSPKENGSSSLSGKYRLPTIYFSKEFVDCGLMSHGADYDAQYRRAAGYVDKVLKGIKPADLLVQQATQFEFVINLKAAKQ